jgi:hypothetical protein
MTANGRGEWECCDRHRLAALNVRSDMDATVETGNQPAAPQHSFALAELRTPKIAAVAGLLFSVLLITIFVLLRGSVPDDPREQGAWLKSDSTKVQIALNLLPFAAIAFLWFIGYLRNRLGPREDRFFSTMFLGSGLLFLSMLLTFAALTGGILVTYSIQPETTTASAAFHIARAAAHAVANIYMTKMAAVFMFATSKVTSGTGIVPRWLTYAGYALALCLLIGSYYFSWSFIVFPLWVLLISGTLLQDRGKGLA